MCRQGLGYRCKWVGNCVIHLSAELRSVSTLGKKFKRSQAQLRSKNSIFYFALHEYGLKITLNIMLIDVLFGY